MDFSRYGDGARGSRVNLQPLTAPTSASAALVGHSTALASEAIGTDHPARRNDLLQSRQG